MSARSDGAAPVIAVIAVTMGCAAAHDRVPPVELAEANDNRSPAGVIVDGVLELRLETRLAAWRPDADVDTAATVLAFAEEGGPATIPGPFLRVPQGTEVRVSVRHAVTEPVRIGTPPPLQRTALVPPAPDAPLIVYGLRAGTVADDTLHIASATAREVRFRVRRAFGRARERRTTSCGRRPSRATSSLLRTSLSRRSSGSSCFVSF